MVKNFAIIISVLFVLMPLGIFIYFFRNNEISPTPNDWGIFATYLSGTTGIIASIVAGWFLFLTLRSQNKQNTEATFFNYLQTFSKENQEISKTLVQYEIEMFEKVHKLQRVTAGSEDEKNKKREYVTFLKQKFIAKYSTRHSTPRLNDSFTKYFRSIANFAFIIMGSNLDRKDREKLRQLFLSLFSDSEIKMVCYYYYLFFDIVNSTDKDFATVNFVSDSGLFGDPLNFSDDFLHNFDPRKGHFDFVIEEIKESYRQKRT